jgi:hypothetical protein
MTRLFSIAMAAVIVGGMTQVARAQADAEREAYERARPVFEKYCTKCHTPTGGGHDDLAIEHLDMSTYPFGGHHGAEAGAEVREALGAAPSGEEATMPDDAPGSVEGDDLALVLAWADEFDRAHGSAATSGMGGMSGMGDHEMHMDENMHDMPDELPETPLGLGMSRDGSGTAWQPDATRDAMHMKASGSWMLMLHYALEAGIDAQSGNRGDAQPIGLGWIMGMASHWFAGGELTFRGMLSPEALVLGKRGYPLLLQTGEGLVDRQHPHDLFMELAMNYQRSIGRDLAFDLYGALSGEPALGPVAFAHRPYALYDMTAPLGHHWIDSTHISFGVVTAGVYTGTVKLEGSWFNGREPDDNRYDLDLRGLDSYAARLSINPSKAWSVEMSYGYLASPEGNTPDVHLQRFVASATYSSDRVDVTAAVGRNMPSIGASTTAALLEASGSICGCKQIILFGRLEALEKLGAELDLAPAVAGSPIAIGAFTIGGVYELRPRHGVTIGVGAHGTIDVVDANAAVYYGTTTPVGALVFVEAHPAR